MNTSVLLIFFPFSPVFLGSDYGIVAFLLDRYSVLAQLFFNCLTLEQRVWMVPIDIGNFTFIVIDLNLEAAARCTHMDFASEEHINNRQTHSH